MILAAGFDKSAREATFVFYSSVFVVFVFVVSYPGLNTSLVCLTKFICMPLFLAGRTRFAIRPNRSVCEVLSTL